jgi:hypothetical protein
MNTDPFLLRHKKTLAAALLGAALNWALSGSAPAQDPGLRFGGQIPPEVESV